MTDITLPLWGFVMFVWTGIGMGAWIGYRAAIKGDSE
jgi:hypothetical protein